MTGWLIPTIFLSFSAGFLVGVWWMTWIIGREDDKERQ